MTTFNENSWDERDARNSETDFETTHIAERNSGNDDDVDDLAGEDDDLLDEDDDLLDDEDDDLDEIDTVGDDVDTDYDEDVLDDEEEEDYEEEALSREFVNDAEPSTFPGQPATETPESEEADRETLGSPEETEFTQQDNGNDASFSEQTDVTPPRPHEFPSVGNATTDFASRDQGRTTGRMIGHEPGTEGI